MSKLIITHTDSVGNIAIPATPRELGVYRYNDYKSREWMYYYDTGSWYYELSGSGKQNKADSAVECRRRIAQHINNEHQSDFLVAVEILIQHAYSQIIFHKENRRRSVYVSCEKALKLVETLGQSGKWKVLTSSNRLWDIEVLAYRVRR